MTNEELDIIYARFAEGNASPEEIDLLKSNGDAELLEKILNHTALWEVRAPIPEPVVKPKGKVRQLRTRKYLAYAATIVVLIGVSTLAYIRYFNITTISTGMAEVKSVELPDGSIVTLDANTQISYNNYNWKNSRELDLTGHAYFEVKSGGDFKVNLLSSLVRVLGTKFEALTNNGTEIIKCFEGMVQVQYNNQFFDVPANQGVRVDPGDVAKEFSFQTSAPSWINEYGKYEGTPMFDILETLAIKHQVEINYETGVDMNQPFTGELPVNDLNASLEILSASFGLEYSADSKVVTIKR